MSLHLRQSVRMLIGCILITLFCVPSDLLAQTHVTSSARTLPAIEPGDSAATPAQTHVVSPADIHKELVSATRTRRQNLEKVKQLFSSDEAQKSLKSVGMDAEQVKTAVSTLSDAELERLASRADKARDDFAAGRISDRDLLIILVGIAVIILIIVAVR